MAKKMTMKAAVKKYEGSKADMAKDKAGAKKLMKKANKGKC